MALWEERCEGKKPSFVDLGCGNGLLVHILSEEGYTGYGIDVRKRKIWDCYPASTKLMVSTDLCETLVITETGFEKCVLSYIFVVQFFKFFNYLK